MLTRKISVLIPAYNEEKRINKTIAAIKKIKNVGEIIVINDGSKDNTEKIAKESGVKVINLDKNKGKGTALNIGAQYIQEDYVALIDADLGETAKELEKLIEPIFNNEADMTVAIFPPPVKKGGIGIVKKTASLGLEKITGKRFLAPLSGQRVMTKKVFDDLIPLSSGFGVEVGMTIDACLKGYRILEVETEMGHAETGREFKDFIHRGKQLKDIIYTFMMKGLKNGISFNFIKLFIY